MRLPEAAEPALLLLVPLLVERALLAGAPPDVTVVRTGMGPRRALAAAETARRTPAHAVAVAGFCGGLTAGLRAGDVVVATSVSSVGDTQRAAEHTLPSAAALAAALRARGIERVRQGPVVSAPRLVHGAERARLAATGALAADMESAWLRAASAGRPFVVLRVVLDTQSSRDAGPLAAVRDLAAACCSLRRAAPALLDWARTVTETSR